MRITICSAYEMAGVVDSYSPDLIISALSPNVTRSGEPNPNHIRLAFYDIEQAKRGDLYGARRGDVDAVINGIGRKPRRLLVTCLVGLSRSPALAIIAAVAAGYSIDTACSAVKAAIPCASPNRWILALGDIALTCDGAIKSCAMDTFTYRRDAHGPIGPRTRFVELPLHIVGSH